MSCAMVLRAGMGGAVAPVKCRQVACSRLTTVVVAQGKLDAVAAALLLTAYFERPEAAIQVESIGRRQ